MLRQIQTTPTKDPNISIEISLDFKRGKGKTRGIYLVARPVKLTYNYSGVERQYLGLEGYTKQLEYIKTYKVKEFKNYKVCLLEIQRSINQIKMLHNLF